MTGVVAVGRSRLRSLLRPAWLLVPLCFLALVGVAGAVIPPAVTDVNPTASPSEPKFGGRVTALTVDPVNAQNVYAAGELGGVWHSTDQGLHWSHVDDVPLFVTRDVEIAPTDSSLIVATGDYDGRVVSKGGIWRSTDGGATWAKPATADPGCTTEPSAYHTAIAPTGSPGSIKIWVGTSCGIAYSADSGQTWTHFSPNGLAGRVWDVQARDLGGGVFQVDACGDNGYARSTTGGATAGSFAAGTNPIPGTGFMPCTLATAPQQPNTVYMTFFKDTTASGFCAPEWVESTNGGGSWTSLNVSGDENCREPFVVTHPSLDGDASKYEVFLSTSQHIVHQRCDTTTHCATGSGNWPSVESGAHPDPTDILFDPSSANGCAILLSNAGGIDRTTVAPASCANSFAWQDSNVGNHGFDIRGLAGTVNPATTDVYFGTQDNGIYYTNDGGTTYTRTGPDVYDVFADHNPVARVLWRSCFGCNWNISNPGLAGTGGFSVPPGDEPEKAFRAAQFGSQSYAFMTRDEDPPNDDWTMYVTTNEGGSWAQMGPSPLAGKPAGPLEASGPPASPTFYFILNTGASGAREVWRMTGPFTSAAVPVKANNGLVNPTTFAVDPVNPNLLYAYDLGGAGGRVMRSINGGSSWTLDSAITTAITRNNEFKLFSNTTGALVSAIAFDGNSDTIMLGTQFAGVFGSPDNGASWFSVRGSEILPRIRDFFFDEHFHNIYVATRGRGLWRINAPAADLSVTKSDSPDPVIAGNELYYTITVHNNGPDAASDIHVTDTLPSQVKFVTSTTPCDVVGQTVTCDIPDLDSGDSFSFTIKVAVKTNAAAGGPTTITNTVSVASGESLDPDLSNNTDTETTIVEDLADLEVTKLCKPDTTPSAGEPIHCTVYVDNHGPSDARGVVLTDVLLAPGAFAVSNVATSQGACLAVVAVTGGQKLECNLGVLQAATTLQSGRATVTYDVSSNEGQDINNVATVRADTPDPDDTNNKATVALNVSAVANLSLTKSDSPDATLTVLVIVVGPPAAAFVFTATLMVKLKLSPLSRSGMSHVTV